MTKQEKIEYLMEKLSSVYCNNCIGDENRCEDCNRKSMGWGLSYETAESIVNKLENK